MAEGIGASFGGKVAEQWSAQLFTPAFAFWAGGLALWCVQDDHWVWLRGELMPASQSTLIIFAVAALIVLVSTATIARRFEPLVIQVLAGYKWPRTIAAPGIRRATERYDNAMRVYEAVRTGTATPKEKRKYEAANETLRRIPPLVAQRRPTDLGNILRAFETASDARYGLDAGICWSRLWLLLPDGARKEISDARGDLDAGTRAWFWGALFALWFLVSWWALGFAVAACIGAYLWMKDAARIYGELIQAAFDVYRGALYTAVRREMPANAADEKNCGLALTAYFYKGSDDPAFVFKTTP
jgi:hypothetical protein